jgi:dUTP pyrophosphatase
MRQRNYNDPIQAFLTPVIKYELINNGKCPIIANDGDSGSDCYANESCIIPAKSRVIVPLGLRCDIPFGYEIQIRPRSGLAAKHGITILNSPGTIDSGYRGEIKAIVYNSSDEDFSVIRHKTRICQIVASQLTKVRYENVETIDINTIRGESGFGSSGGICEK